VPSVTEISRCNMYAAPYVGCKLDCILHVYGRQRSFNSGVSTSGGRGLGEKVFSELGVLSNFSYRKALLKIVGWF